MLPDVTQVSRRDSRRDNRESSAVSHGTPSRPVPSRPLVGTYLSAQTYLSLWLVVVVKIIFLPTYVTREWQRRVG